jgi:hypothetical protein
MLHVAFSIPPPPADYADGHMIFAISRRLMPYAIAGCRQFADIAAAMPLRYCMPPIAITPCRFILITMMPLPPCRHAAEFRHAFRRYYAATPMPPIARRFSPDMPLLR